MSLQEALSNALLKNGGAQQAQGGLARLKDTLNRANVKVDLAKAKLKSKIQSANPEHVRHQFEKIFKGAKVSALIFLILISFVYLYKYRNTKEDSTLLSTGAGKATVFSYSALTGIFGVLSVMFVYWNRGLHTLSGTKTYILIFTILALFEFAKESSGYNRYSAMDDIQKGKSIYNKIDQINGVEAKKKEETGDPFLVSMADVVYYGLVVAVVIIIFKLILVAFSGRHAYGINGNYTIGAGKCALELAAMALINTIPIFVGAWMRGDEFSDLGWFDYLTPIIAVILHVMFQWSGCIPNDKTIDVNNRGYDGHTAYGMTEDGIKEHEANVADEKAKKAKKDIKNILQKGGDGQQQALPVEFNQQEGKKVYWRKNGSDPIDSSLNTLVFLGIVSTVTVVCGGISLAKYDRGKKEQNPEESTNETKEKND